jgi:tetratricopeptide (TPR) repeat protein
VFYRAMALSHIPRRGNDAEEAFLRAIKMAPKKIEYYASLGAFYEKYGLKAKAISLYQDALKHDPNAEKIKQALQKLNR